MYEIIINLFNNSFWTNKLTYSCGLDVRIPFDGNDVRVTKRKNFDFDQKLVINVGW